MDNSATRGTSMKKIVITGSIAYDYLMSFPGHFSEVIMPDQLQNISLSFLVDTMVKQRGGVAPNIAYTMAMLGGRPSIMATAGQDFSEYRAWLEEQGVNTSAIVDIDDVFTASFFVTTDLDQNQIASFYTGAMAFANTLTFGEYAPDADLATISPNDPRAMQAYIRECKQLGIPYIYDPSQQTIRLSGEELYEGLDGCFLLAVNTYEFHLIQERTGLDRNGVLDLVCGLLITSGADGSELIIDGQIWHIPVVPPSKIVEPTGAGDAFRGGLIRGIELGFPWPIAGRMGALASTHVLENIGTQNHHFTPESFVTRFRQYFDDEGALDVLILPQATG
jgi:adenosine kinase